MSHFAIIVLKHLFSFLCVSVTIGMIMFWIYEFLKDKDLCLVDYIDYANATKSGVYPTISLCFMSPFATEKLKVHNVTFNDDMHAKFLRGETYDDNMAKLDFDNVTYSLLDYLGQVAIEFRNHTYLEIDNANDLKLKTFATFYNEDWSEGISKCIILEMDPATINQICFAVPACR